MLPRDSEPTSEEAKEAVAKAKVGMRAIEAATTRFNRNATEQVRP